MASDPRFVGKLIGHEQSRSSSHRHNSNCELTYQRMVDWADQPWEFIPGQTPSRRPILLGPSNEHWKGSHIQEYGGSEENPARFKRVRFVLNWCYRENKERLIRITRDMKEIQEKVCEIDSALT